MQFKTKYINIKIHRCKQIPKPQFRFTSKLQYELHCENMIFPSWIDSRTSLRQVTEGSNFMGHELTKIFQLLVLLDYQIIWYISIFYIISFYNKSVMFNKLNLLLYHSVIRCIIIQNVNNVLFCFLFITHFMHKKYIILSAPYVNGNWVGVNLPHPLLLLTLWN